ncbi:signal peptidase I [Myceligenerans salitolerans]|uniref:Signal peptidase I n=1 Tax=Myceligenerans salitolerans TaxID=1230528 RepID=A0ABS3I3N9_9MICO|nr:signal peptidase I [Myceligenerans salitolerans]MBO0607602.1 signal peptidase I [Myceligenerans salitolerans]
MLRFLGRVVAVLVIVTGATALAAGVLVPRLTGATPYVVTSGSMAPALPAGTLIVTRPANPSDLRIGDVVTYQLRSGEPTVATHRVVGVGSTATGERTFVTQGDANNAADVRPVRAVQVQGRLWYFVPYLGHAAALVTGDQRQAVTTGIVVLLLGYAGWQVVAMLRERGGRRAPPPASGAPARSGATAVGLVLASGLAATALAPAVTARAAQGSPAATSPAVGLSLDGETWTGGGISPRFTRDLHWVPGDVDTLTFYARNESGSTVQGRAEVLLPDDGNRLAQALSFRTRLDDAAWHGSARSAPVTLAPGEAVPVSVEVAFAPGSANASQRGRVPFDVRVTMTELSAGARVPEAPPRSGAGTLAPTGTAVPVLLLVAAVAVATGIALRRRHD